MKPLVIAHRGASYDAPENTLRAFQLAADQGAAMLEFDVRPSRDGQIVVFHDDTTERWNNRAERVDDLPWSVLSELDLRGERMPRLAELLGWARGTELRLNVEIKAPGIEATVAQLVREHDLVERVVVSCFDPEVLRRMRGLAPDQALGMLTGREQAQRDPEGARLLDDLQALGARAWHPAWNLPNLDRHVERVRAAGYAVYVWTVDDPAEMRRLAALPVDGIMTNRPALLRDVLAT